MYFVAFVPMTNSRVWFGPPTFSSLLGSTKEMPVSSLTELYRVNDVNLGLRRTFIGLSAGDVAVLGRLAGWAERRAGAIAKEFYDHQFSFGPTSELFAQRAQETGRTLEQLRGALEGAQAAYFSSIFAEAASGNGFGSAYFETRLAVGKLHNSINLPLKWYIGSYQLYFTLARKQLRRHYPTRPRLRARVEAALLAVFNYDIQAIVDGFYYDTFTTMGINVETVDVSRREHDLSDNSERLKATVTEALLGLTTSTADLRASSIQMASSAEETGLSVNEAARAVSEIAQSAGRQLRSVEVARGVTDEASLAVGRARTAVREGTATASEATEAMHAVRNSSAALGEAMEGLQTKSEQIGGIIDAITGIASQTNLLALNAAIEAARAGEQGRGFAVVAEEVRKLAEESQQAAGRISRLIEEIQHETTRASGIVQEGTRLSETGSETVARAHEAFQTIETEVEAVTARIAEIVTATLEIAGAAEESSAATEQVSASTQQTAATTQQVTATAQALARTAETLDGLAARFQLVP